VKPPRGLSAAEAALWQRVTETVKPLEARKARPTVPPPEKAVQSPPASPKPKGRVPPPRPSPAPASPSPGPGLDSSWERKLARASLDPDFTLDLHGHTLDQAHRRLDMGLGQAKAMGARLVLLITGHPRPTDAADRGTQRGAIRAKVLDWLAAGPHGSDIAAIRPAHRRHGGTGALYLVLKRTR
jgi:DNA-nicking Smr family endonuclease